MIDESLPGKSGWAFYLQKRGDAVWKMYDVKCTMYASYPRGIASLLNRSNTNIEY